MTLLIALSLAVTLVGLFASARLHRSLRPALLAAGASLLLAVSLAIGPSAFLAAAAVTALTAASFWNMQLLARYVAPPRNRFQRRS
jgi:hypothetical protein